MSYVDELRERLFVDTIHHAFKNSAFYNDLYSHAIHYVKTLYDIKKLPTISKDDLAAKGSLMLTSKSFPSRLGLSSGTTFGDYYLERANKSSSLNDHNCQGIVPPAIRYQSHDEINLLASLPSLVQSNSSSDRRLGLAITSEIHGGRLARLPIGVLSSPLQKKFHYANIVNILTSTFSFSGFTPRVKVLTGSFHKLKVVSELVRNDRPDLFQELADLDLVISHGTHLSERWKMILESVYNAQLINLYGLSEIAGSNCIQCHYCGHFHMPPIVMPEVLDLYDDNLEVSSGIGELVLTSLYPFTSLQPLIRYRTGDIVQAFDKKVCQSIDDITFQPLGRVSKSVIDRSLGILIPSSLLFEIIDDIPEVSRTRSSNLDSFGLGLHLGHPRYKIELAKDNGILTINIFVELVYDPFHYQDRACQLKDLIHKRCGVLTDNLSQALNRNQAKIKVILTPPNGLDLTDYRHF